MISKISSLVASNHLIPEGHFKYSFCTIPPEEGKEILTAFLEDFPFHTIQEFDEGIEAYISESDDKNFKIENLMEMLPGISFRWKKEFIPYQNWNEEWEKNFEPVIIDDEILIHAPFHKIDKNFSSKIIIQPQMSFGTGHHPTTRLVLRSLKALNLTNKSVLDFGCGSGILAIASLKWGASVAMAVDHDPICVQNTQENAKLNHLENIQATHLNDFLIDIEKKNNKYDVILANINKNVIKQYLDMFKKCSDENTIFIFSGFYASDIDELSNECRKKLNRYDILASTEDAWACLVIR
jgi:ribosomal protein L11 methyltransferase